MLDPSSESVQIDSTGALILPKGTTVQRPGSPTTGMIRYNTDTNVLKRMTDNGLIRWSV